MTQANRRQPKIVLLCGMLGFTRMLCWEYFRGVPAMLQKQGFTVLIPQMPLAQRSETRARFLAKFLEHESGPLHLIAHSMGGVDARFYIRHLGGRRKTASLTTLASPHRGSILADHEMNTWYSPYRHLPAVTDLTLAAMADFNKQTPNCDMVVYRSYSAARPVHELPWLMRRFGRRIEAIEGANDSQVSVTSAIWGEHIATLSCDHFELTGMNIWFNPLTARKRFDHLPVYRDIADWIRNFESRFDKNTGKA